MGGLKETTEQARTTSRAGTGSRSSPPFTPDVTQVSSVTQSCQTLCDPMDCSMPGLPVHHQLLELAQTHVHGVGDAIQPSHPLLLSLSLDSERTRERVLGRPSVYIKQSQNRNETS